MATSNSIMEDENLNTAFGILSSSLDLLKVAKLPLNRSCTQESADALRLVQNLIPQLQQELNKNSSKNLKTISSENEMAPGSQRNRKLRKKSKHSQNRPLLLSDDSTNSNNSTNFSLSSSMDKSKFILSNSIDKSVSEYESVVKANEDELDDEDEYVTILQNNVDDSKEDFHLNQAPALSKEGSISVSLKEQSEIYDLALKAQEAFMILDKDHSGYLDVAELREAFKTIPKEKLDDMIHQMVEMNNENEGNDGNEGSLKIRVAEFVEMFTNQQIDNSTFVAMRPAITEITDVLIKEHNQRNKTLEDALFPLDLTADFLFVLDVVKHFWTGFIDEFDYTIMVTQEVRAHYIGTWFVPDMLSSIPVEIINLIFTSGLPSFLRASRILKLLRLSRLTKVFRLMKITKLGTLIVSAKESIEDRFRIQIPEAFLILGRLWMSLLILAHWVGCINFMLARLYDFPEESWVVFASLVHANISVQYSWCFFKALAQLIGVGFDTPPIVNTSCEERTQWCTVEHWITLVCLYIGSVYVALLVSSISYVIVNMNKGSENLNMQLWILNEYLDNKKVPYEVRDRVRNFYRITFAEGKMYNEEEVLGLLPPNLRDDILCHNLKMVFDQVPLFSHCDLFNWDGNTGNNMNAIRLRLAPMLEKRVMLKNEEIFVEGSLGAEIFFIVSGIVDICSEFVEFENEEEEEDDDDDDDDDEDNYHGKGIVKSISDGCYFGDVAVLLGNRRTATTRARTNLVLSVISKDNIIKVLSEFPQVKNYMMSIAKKRRDRLFSLDPENVDLLPLSEEQLTDIEDSHTKYRFMLLF